MGGDKKERGGGPPPTAFPSVSFDFQASFAYALHVICIRHF